MIFTILEKVREQKSVFNPPNEYVEQCISPM